MGAHVVRRAWVPVALRRMRVHRTVLAAVIVTVALTTAFAAALITYSSQAGDAAVRSALRNAGGTAITFSGAAPAEPVDQATAQIRGQLAGALGGIGVTVYAAPELESLALPGSTPVAGKVATLLAPTDLAAHGRLVAGSWPHAGSADPGGDVPIALDRAAATILGAGPGSRITTLTTGGTSATFAVTGVFTPIDPQSAYWTLDPLAGAGSQASSGYTTFGPFFTDASYLDGGTLAAQQMEWEAVPDTQEIGASGLVARSAALERVLSQFGHSSALGNPGIATELPPLLTNLASAALVAQSLVYAELLELLVVAIAALFIVVRLLTEVRETEAALLWARGGTGPQLIRLRATESVLLATPAVLISPFAASPLAATIGTLGGGQSASFPHDAIPVAVWAGVVGCALGAVAVILAPAFGSAVSPLALRTKRSRQGAVTAVGRAGFDLALLALAGFACWQLLSTGSIVGTDQSGNATYSPIVIAAPALALAAGAALALRLLPPAARLGDRLARRGRALAVPLAFWQTGRKPLRLAGPVLLTMLAVATGVLSLSEYASAERSAADQATFTVGADADVRLSSGQFTTADLAELASSPGVSAVSPLFRSTFVPSGSSSLQSTLLAVDPAGAAHTVTLRADLSTASLSVLMNDVAHRPDASGDLPAIATQALAHELNLGVGDLTSVPVGTGNLKVRIVAIVAGFPTISTAGGGLVVSDGAAKLAPNEAWLNDSSTATPRNLPAASVVTFRTQVQQQLRSAPLAEEPLRALLAVALATTLLALCGLIVSVLSTGAERSAEFALLDALGFSRRGRIGTLCLEQALLVVPGALAGVALGLLLGRVVIPVATLTADAAKPQPPVTVLTPWPQVVIGVAALLAAPLVTAAIAGSRRRETAAVLREGADR
ncbi:FtsX-like permease family protein [Actinospica sp.]|uniref:FtsX-like permease family protein n=1 Tax=Actinospica sp. TaxID=1872142 RepID=UPI002C6FFB35|nr:FtsX-like permease family protein [Actinospica sp.]HWG26982.1 FtsX-like permease family protein [Actinospica sp.]